MPLIAPLALIAALVSGGPAAASAEREACRVADARYALRGEPRMTARFIRVGRHQGWISDVAFSFRSPAGKTFWWLFDRGSSRILHIISTTDVEVPGWRPPEPDGGPRPHGWGDYYALDGALTFATELPKADAPAPKYIFIPGLADRLWYAPEPREHVPTAFFELTGCGSR